MYKVPSLILSAPETLIRAVFGKIDLSHGT